MIELTINILIQDSCLLHACTIIVFCSVLRNDVDVALVTLVDSKKLELTVLLKALFSLDQK